LSAIESREFDAVLMDLNYARDTTSGQEGLDLLTNIQMLDSTLPVVVMTAWSSIEVAVEAMRRGARDFVQKPWRTRACSPFCARKLICGRRCARLRGSKPRIASCVRNHVPRFWQNRPLWRRY